MLKHRTKFKAFICLLVVFGTLLGGTISFRGNPLYANVQDMPSCVADFGVRANGRLYHEDLDFLQNLVFDEARSNYLEFDYVLSLDITAFTNTNVIIVRGEGERLTIQYYEWLENQYSVRLENGMLTLYGFNFPDHKIPAGSVRNWGTTQSDIFLMNWLERYLSTRDMTHNHAIKIIIPNTMTLDDINITTFGSGNLQWGRTPVCPANPIF